MHSVFWIHPQLRDYRLELFKLVSRKHEVVFFFQLPSDVKNELKSTVSDSHELRRITPNDLRVLISRIANSEILVTSFLWSFYSITGLAIAKLLRKKVVIWEEQSHRFPGFKSRVKRSAMAALARLTDAFFVLGSPQKSFLQQLGVPSERIFVSNEYPGLCFNSVPAIPIALPFGREKRIVLFIGRLIEVKGTEYLLRAFKRLESCIDDVALLIVGDGPLRDRLERLVLDLGIRNVHFAGWVEDPCEKSYLFRVSTLLVVPSIIVSSGEAEGGPLVVLEALSAGRPVVGTTSLGSSTSFIVNGVNGVIVPERDEDSLYRAIAAVLADAKGFSARAADHFLSIPGHREQARTIDRAFDYVTSN